MKLGTSDHVTEWPGWEGFTVKGQGHREVKCNFSAEGINDQVN